MLGTAKCIGRKITDILYKVYLLTLEGESVLTSQLVVINCSQMKRCVYPLFGVFAF